MDEFLTGGCCPQCGQPRDTLYHVLVCDGRQGAIEALEVIDACGLPAAEDAAALGALGRSQVDGAESREDEPFDADGAGLSFLATLDRLGPTTGERLVMAAKNDGFVPHDDRAFGSIFLRLARGGHIHKVGFERRMRGHGADGAVVWALTRAS